VSSAKESNAGSNCTFVYAAGMRTALLPVPAGSDITITLAGSNRQPIAAWRWSPALRLTLMTFGAVVRRHTGRTGGIGDSSGSGRINTLTGGILQSQQPPATPVLLSVRAAIILTTALPWPLSAGSLSLFTWSMPPAAWPLQVRVGVVKTGVHNSYGSTHCLW